MASSYDPESAVRRIETHEELRQVSMTNVVQNIVDVPEWKKRPDPRVRKVQETEDAFGHAQRQNPTVQKIEKLLIDSQLRSARFQHPGDSKDATRRE